MNGNVMIIFVWGEHCGFIKESGTRAPLTLLVFVI